MGSGGGNAGLGCGKLSSHLSASAEFVDQLMTTFFYLFASMFMAMKIIVLMIKVMVIGCVAELPCLELVHVFFLKKCILVSFCVGCSC